MAGINFKHIKGIGDSHNKMLLKTFEDLGINDQKSAEKFLRGGKLEESDIGHKGVFSLLHNYYKSEEDRLTSMIKKRGIDTNQENIKNRIRAYKDRFTWDTSAPGFKEYAEKEKEIQRELAQEELERKRLAKEKSQRIARENFFKRQEEKDRRRQELENKINSRTPEQEATRIAKMLQNRGFSQRKSDKIAKAYGNRPKDASTIFKGEKESKDDWKKRLSQKYEKDASGEFVRKEPTKVIPGIKKLSEKETEIRKGDKINIKTSGKGDKEVSSLLKGMKNIFGSKSTVAGLKGGAKVVGKGVKYVGAAGLWAANSIGRGINKRLQEPPSGGVFIFLAIALYFSDLFKFPFDGISFDYVVSVFSNWNSALTLLRFFGSIAFIPLSILITRWVLGTPNKKEIVWFSGLLVTIFTIVTLGRVDVGFILHLVFAGMYMNLFLIPRYNEDKSQAYKVTTLLILFDFIGFSAASYISGNALISGPGSELLKSIGEFMSNRQLFPVWILYTAAVSYKIKARFWKMLIIFFIIFFATVSTLGVGSFRNGLANTQQMLGIGAGSKTTTGEAQENVEKGWKKFWGELTGTVKKTYDESISYATGDYYTGKVDQNVKEPLGVYITNIETLDPEVYDDEDIEIWANLRARSLEEPISLIKVNCTADTEEKKTIEGKSSVTEFRGFIDDEEDIDCKFEAGVLEEGSHLIIFTAEFDFTTLAYLKTYFINDERLKAFKRENIDVFKEYGISDKNPISVYTNGPVGIGMETKTPPIGISDNYDTTPKFGITIENKWLGKIKEIKDLIICLPAGIELEDYCDGAFEDLKQNEYEDQDYSIEKHKCYRFVEGVIASKQTEWKDIKDYKSRNCRLSISNAGNVLGDTPISTKYIKARIKYIYTSEEHININVKTPKGFNVYFEPKKPSLDEDIDCVASHSDLYVIRAPFEIYRNDEKEAVYKETVECGDKKHKCYYTIPTSIKKKFERGDKIKCKVNKAKLSNSIEETDSAVVKIQNSAPSVKARIDPKNPKEGQDLECIAEITDPEGDDYVFTYEVKKNDRKLNPSELELVKDGGIKILIKNDNVDGGLKENDKIYCEISALDMPADQDFEGKWSEPAYGRVTIKSSAVTSRSGGIAISSYKCKDDSGNPINEGKACEEDSNKNCLNGICVPACKYLAEKGDNTVKKGWECKCGKDMFNDKMCEESEYCVLNRCPKNQDVYCCNYDGLTKVIIPDSKI